MNNNPLKKTNGMRMFWAVWWGALLLGIAFTAGIVYVLLHFIGKFW